MKKKHYNVWICLEEYNPETDQYEDLDMPFAATGIFDSENEALNFATKLHETGKGEIQSLTNMDAPNVGVQN